MSALRPVLCIALVAMLSARAEEPAPKPAPNSVGANESRRSVFDITAFGAKGDGTTCDSVAIQKAIDACAESGGGTVRVPGGRAYLIGTIQLKSHVELYLESGSRLLASENRADYHDAKLQFLIYAENAEHVSITGTGIIDGRGKLFMAEDLGFIYRAKPWRPRTLGVVRCKHITMRDFTMKDAALWGVHLAVCEDVRIDGIRILNDMKIPNCDGIDPDHCRNVRISNCHVEAGDDCIVIKNTREFADAGPSENITVTGCTLKSTSSALKIGTEGVSDFRNIVFNACVVSASSRGLSIQIRDQGNVENVIFSNIVVETQIPEERWWGKGEPIYVSAERRNSDPSRIPKWNPENKLGRIRNVTFSNIVCRSENGIFIAAAAPEKEVDGVARYFIEGVTLDNVKVSLDRWTPWPGGFHDRRPVSFYDPKLKDPGVDTHTTAGFFVQHAASVTLRNGQAEWNQIPEKRAKEFRHALESHDAPDLRIEQFKGKGAHRGDADQVSD